MTLLTIIPEAARIIGGMVCVMAFLSAIFRQELSSLFKRKPKEEPRQYLMRRFIEYRLKVIELSVTEYESEPEVRSFGVPLYRVAWSACDHGAYTLASEENIEEVIKEWYLAAQKHIDNVLATPDQLARVKDLLDNLEL